MYQVESLERDLSASQRAAGLPPLAAAAAHLDLRGPPPDAVAASPVVQPVAMTADAHDLSSESEETSTPDNVPGQWCATVVTAIREEGGGGRRRFYFTRGWEETYDDSITFTERVG